MQDIDEHLSPWQMKIRASIDSYAVIAVWRATVELSAGVPPADGTRWR